MGISTLQYASFLSLLVFSCFRSGQLRHCHGAPTVSCREDERMALLQFKAGLVDDAGHLSSWVGQDCCSWWGVTCSNNTGHVVTLSLSTQDGSIQGGNEINPSLLVLRHLTYLDLSWISFEGAPIPKFIGSFQKLRYLNLSYAGLVGAVPAELGSLSNLRYLDLTMNLNMSALAYLTLDSSRGLTIDNDSWLSHLSSLRYLDLSYVMIKNGSSAMQWLGMLPLLSELHLRVALTCVPGALLVGVNFTSLRALDLSDNELNTTLPPWLFEIGSLKHLDLSHNNFTGHVPHLNYLSSLELLHLSNNQLNGPLPESLGQLSRLVELDLRENSFDGVLTEAHFTNLTSLDKLYLADNQLTIDIRRAWSAPWKLTELILDGCIVGPAFPAWLRGTEDISTISMSNVGISDAIPDWFWNLSLNISSVDLSNNKINGKLPASLRHLKYLSFLDLQNNQLEGPLPQFSMGMEVLMLSNNSLSGPIPQDIGEMMANKRLVLSGNKLNGSVPSSICRLKELQILDLSGNQLSGEIPDCWDNNNGLDRVDLSSNELSGNVPASVCSGFFLNILSLESNVLSGGLPLALLNCTKLEVLDLGNNMLTGSIPTWLGNISTRLSVLRLHSNMFHGIIPRELGYLSSLGVVDLSCNKLSGSIPKSFANFNPMKHSDDNAGVQIRGTVDVTTKGRDQTYSIIMKMPSTIDLSSNNLSGGIPEALTTLAALQNLNLSRNQLTGTIPWSIEGLQSLESLDLSFNDLTGEIPPSMSALSFLSVMNFSFNDLSGRIPMGGQFGSQDSSIYTGNDHLCGFPLNSTCGGSAYQPSHNTNTSEEEEKEEVWFHVSAIFGFVTGVWTLGALLLKNKWRIAYFRMVDHSFDMFYVFAAINVAKVRGIYTSLVK